jgi:hypothetical protein
VNSLEEILAHFLRAARVTSSQLFSLSFPALFLVYVTSLSAGYLELIARKALGTSLYIVLFGWFGTLVHETGHALTAIIFGHHVNEFRPFVLDTKTGTLGYTDIAYNRNNLYAVIGLFFFGIAPIIFGVVVIFLSLYFIFQDQMKFEVNRVLFADNANTIGRVISSAFSF